MKPNKAQLERERRQEQELLAELPERLEEPEWAWQRRLESVVATWPRE